MLTPEGEKIRTFGTAGSGNEQFNNMFGVAVDNDDNIFVTITEYRSSPQRESS